MKTRKKPIKKADAPVKLMQSHSPAALAGVATADTRVQARDVSITKPTVKMLLAGGRIAYESWVREAGYAKDARIMSYDKLKAHMHARWERVAADVFKAMRGAE